MEKVKQLNTEPINDDWFDKLIKKHNFDSGDIILFQHQYQVKKWSDLLFDTMDFITSLATVSKYTHVGIIIKNPQWRPDLKGYYFMESDRESFTDMEDDEIKMGVELVSLKEVLDKNRQNKLWYRKLHCNRDFVFNINLNKAQSIAHNRPYDLMINDWIKALLHLHIGNEQRQKTFFCSAMVTFFYVKLGLLAEDTDWTIISPKELGTEYSKYELNFINCIVDSELELEY